jgi:hypothetical protein
MRRVRSQFPQSGFRLSFAARGREVSGGAAAAIATFVLAFAFASTLPSFASAATVYALDSVPSLCSATGTAAGQCAGPLKGVAVDQSNGNVYVVDGGNLRIDQFDADGNFVRAFGYNVRADDPAANTPQVCTTDTGCVKGTSAANPADGQIGTTASRGIAVDPATHIVYIAASAARVGMWDGSTGAYIGTMTGTVGATPAAPEAFAATSGLAVDTSNPLQHYLYVAINVNGGSGLQTKTLIDKFAVAGPGGTPRPAYVCQISGRTPGTATECSSGGSNGGAYPALAMNGQTGANLATDASGRVYIAERIDATENRSVITSFSTLGGFLSQFTPTFTRPEALATKPNGNVLAAVGGSASGTGGARIQEYDPAAPTIPVSDFGSGTIGGSLGLAVDKTGLASDGNVYVSDTTNARVWRYELTVVSAPAISALQANVTPPDTAQLNAKINPNGDATTYHLEYVTEAVYQADLGTGDGFQHATATPESASIGSDTTFHDTSDPLGGLAVSTDYRWRVVATNSVGTVKSASAAFSTVPPPVIADGAGADPVGPTTATIAATVDPIGDALSDCHFEYLTHADYVANGSSFSGASTAATIACSPSGASIPPSGGPVAVTAALAGLDPDTTYHYRLKAANRGGTATQPGRTFVTLATPHLSNIGAVSVTATSALLVADVNPKLSPTSYVFEYGPTAALGSTTQPADIGAGSGDVTVTHELTDLDPSSQYFFRVVASNARGEASSLPASFSTRSLVAHQARAWEMVTPLAKGFGHADDGVEGQSRFTVADDGQSIGYCNSSAAGAQVGVYCGDYIAQRKPDGWHNRVIAPVACGNDFEATTFTLGGQKRLALTKNLDYAIITQPESASCGRPPLDAAAPLPSNNLYRQDLSSDTPSFDLLTTSPGYPAPTSFNSLSGNYAGGSDDGSHVVFASTGAQTGDPYTLDGTQRLFLEVDGQTSLISRGVDDSPLVGNSVLGGNPQPLFSGTNNGMGSVSADGREIYFQNPAAPSSNPTCAANNCELYLRDDDARTVWASEQECSPACSNVTAPNVYRWANAGGDRALFTTTAKLVNGDPTLGGTDDLYMYRHSDDPAADPHNLVLLSADKAPGDGVNADVRGILGESDDGDTVYFVADGQLVAGAPTAAGAKIYRWRWNAGTPTLDYLATVTEGDRHLWDYSPGLNSRTMIERVMANGQYLLVDSLVRLDPAADHDADRDVYRWSEARAWECLSCQPPGAPSAGRSDVHSLRLSALDAGQQFQQNGQTQNADLVRVSSVDGDRVFFASSDRLDADDVNDVQDVYLWDNGTVGLVSSGEGTSPSLLIATSKSGNDVFFLTTDRLVGWDTDGLYDVYDMRVDGGLPEPEPEPAKCVGDGCHGPGASPVELDQQTGTPGEGNSSVGPRGRFSVAKLTARTRRALARGRAVSLAVRTNMAGRISLLGTGKVAGRTRQVVSTSIAVTRPGVTAVPLELTAAARRELVKTRRLRVAIDVRFSAVRRRLTRALILELAKPGKKKRMSHTTKGAGR